MMCIFEDLVLIMNLYDFLNICGHAIFVGLGLITFYIAVSYGDVTLLSIVLTSDIPIRVVMQFVMFSDLQPEQTGWVDVLGAMLVALAVSILPISQLIARYRDKTGAKNEPSEDTETKPFIDHEIQ